MCVCVYVCVAGEGHKRRENEEVTPWIDGMEIAKQHTVAEVVPERSFTRDTGKGQCEWVHVRGEITKPGQLCRPPQRVGKVQTGTAVACEIPLRPFQTHRTNVLPCALVRV